MSFVRDLSLRGLGLCAIHLFLATLIFAGGSRAAADAARSKSKERLFHILPSETEVEFSIPRKGLESINGQFPKGVSGTLNLANPKKSQFAIQLDTLKTQQKHSDAFDRHMVEAFFGVRESSDAREDVEQAWEKLSGKLTRHVGHAHFEVDRFDGLDSIADGKRGLVRFYGRLVLWGSIRRELSLEVEVHRNGDRMELKGKDFLAIDLEEWMGRSVFQTAKAAFAATGDPAAKQLPEQVLIRLKKVVLTSST